MKPCTPPILAAIAAIVLSGPAASEPSLIQLETPLQGGSLRLPPLNDHLLRDIGLFPGKADMAPALHAFQERNFR